jgi:hypothetical protein
MQHLRIRRHSRPSVENSFSESCIKKKYTRLKVVWTSQRGVQAETEKGAEKDTGNAGHKEAGYGGKSYCGEGRLPWSRI